MTMVMMTISGLVTGTQEKQQNLILHVPSQAQPASPSKRPHHLILIVIPSLHYFKLEM